MMRGASELSAWRSVPKCASGAFECHGQPPDGCCPSLTPLRHTSTTLGTHTNSKESAFLLLHLPRPLSLLYSLPVHDHVRDLNPPHLPRPQPQWLATHLHCHPLALRLISIPTSILPPPARMDTQTPPHQSTVRRRHHQACYRRSRMMCKTPRSRSRSSMCSTQISG